jgi:hypothetical protein
VYPNKENKEIYSQLASVVFSDTVYMKVKELYEQMFDDEDNNI